jgi:hypothetical protein
VNMASAPECICERGAGLGADWLDTPEADMARRESGWPDCTPEEFIEALIRVIDAIGERAEFLDKWLRGRGLTFTKFCEMAADVKLARASCTEASDVEKHAIRRLFLCGFEPDVIATLLEIPAGEVADYVRRQRMLAQGPEVVKLHLEGVTPLEISRRTGVARKRVYDILEDIDERPHQSQRRLPQATRDRIVGMYLDGASYGEIQRQLHVEKYQVTNTLRLAKRRGDLPQYGSKAS